MENSYIPPGWEELKKQRDELPIVRTEEVDRQYDEHRKLVKDPSRHILRKYFSDDKPYCFVNNLFPYHIDSSISHFLLWINPKNYTDFQNEETVQCLLSEILIEGTEFMFWMNKPAKQSVKGVPHYHVFTRTPPL